MKFTDIFVQRPVLSLVLSMLILVLGTARHFSAAGQSVPGDARTRSSPSPRPTTARMRTTVAGFITQPLEAAIAQAQGIDYLSSSSSTGVSVITATLRLNYDSNRALTEINTKVTSVRNQLPPQAQQPVLTVQVGQTTDAMYIGYFSDTLPTNGLTRLPRTRRQAEARLHRRCADGGSDRCPAVRFARVARSRPDGGARVSPRPMCTARLRPTTT